MSGSIHLIKLSVGTKDVAHLREWQASRAQLWPDGKPRHITRRQPKRADALLDGGSIYWVIGGVILARQALLRFDTVYNPPSSPDISPEKPKSGAKKEQAESLKHCAMVLSPLLLPTRPTPRRAFQGWRYLLPQDCPPDISDDTTDDTALPPALRQALFDMGVV